MCVHVEGDGRGGGGGIPQAPPLDFFFLLPHPPPPEDRSWHLLGWAPKVMAWAPNLEISLGSSLASLKLFPSYILRGQTTNTIVAPVNI